MACKRDRIIELKEYIESLGIDINIGKNKARGNKGIFLFGNKNDSTKRIDISGKISDEKILPTIIHEFSHYVHHIYDNSMTSLDFAFGTDSPEIMEELLKITVHEISQDSAKKLFEYKNKTSEKIKELSKTLKSEFSSFKSTGKFLPIESKIKYPYKYLVKYDRVKIFNNVLSVENINEYSLLDFEKLYIILKSKQREQNRINSRISRLNKYYNKNSELFARFTEIYFTNHSLSKKIAPLSSYAFEKKLKSNKLPEFNKIANILLQ